MRTRSIFGALPLHGTCVESSGFRWSELVSLPSPANPGSAIQGVALALDHLRGPQRTFVHGVDHLLSPDCNLATEDAICHAGMVRRVSGGEHGRKHWSADRGW